MLILTGEMNKYKFGSHAVGVWNLTTNTLLGKATVLSSNPATGYFRYVALSKPIALNTTDTYSVAGITGSSYYTAQVPVSSAIGNIPAEISYVSIATWSKNPADTTAESSPTTSLIKPNLFTWGPSGAGIGPDFGANFIFASAALPVAPFTAHTTLP